MDNLTNDCCSEGKNETPGPGGQPKKFTPLPMMPAGPDGSVESAVSDQVCCGSPPSPPSSDLERPGYKLMHFVDEFRDTPAGPIPVVKTKLERPDRWGTLGARLGGIRDDYRVAPGLYAVGGANSESPVLATANYKLSFDALRKELGGLDAWILVLDTRGINVWCAAGKGLFGTAEALRQVEKTGLAEVVEHRKLIMPQLGATGVSARQVKKGCGFEVVWGPIKAKDIGQFIRNGYEADTEMRRMTFSTIERLVLTPVEVYLLKKHLLWAVLAIIALSGIGPGIFSAGAVWSRGLLAASAVLVGVLTGAVFAPGLLPWLPTRAFAVKGAVTGLFGGLGLVFLWPAAMNLWEGVAMVLLTLVLSSFLTMNFTGSTPFTSPSGVEKEMRKAIPVQLVLIACAAAVWLASAFAA